VPSRRIATVLAAALLPLALTACGSGRDPETYNERRTVDAASASLGDLEVRNVHITAPEGDAAELAVGDDATLTLAVVNLGEAPDRLVGVASDIASSIEVLDAGGQPTDQVDVPPLGVVAEDDFSVTLTGLTQALRPGQHAEVTFTFVRAGRKTLTVPVETYTEPVPRPTHDVFEEHELENAADAGEG
jgi:copper(I)-binding protein